MYAGKPIIGIVGGIGSGKTHVARLFGELGCLVIEADQLVREAYEDADVKREIRRWWGGEPFKVDGTIDRGVIGRKVFSDPEQRKRLEGLLHPWVNTRRRIIQAGAPGHVAGFIWDTPLLFETGLNRECDAVVYVDVPEAIRLERVARQRGWDAAELRRREILQMPLDNKRRISDYVVTNIADAGPDDPSPGEVLGQIQGILSRIVAGLPEGL